MKVNAKSKLTLREKFRKIALPNDYPWKVLAWLTNDLAEFLTVSDFERLKGIVRKRDVSLLGQLTEDWSLQRMASDGVSIGEFRAKYQLGSLLKKYQFSSDKEDRVLAAKNKFYAAEDKCLVANEFFATFANDCDTPLTYLLQEMRGFIKRVIGERPISKSVLLWSRHGPGATLQSQDGNISSYHKYSEWPYTCTEDASRYAIFAIATDQRWYGALQDSYRERKHIPKHYPLNEKKFWKSVIRIVDGNRITFVPKDARTERTIAIEPTMNLYLQLGVDGFIRERLKRFDINLDDQSKNQWFARQGSISGEYATLDLSAASDCISTGLCQAILPDDWYTYLMSIRSPQGLIDKAAIRYNKIASMGNGYTFALESLIFAAAIFATQKFVNGKSVRGSYAVYGDDLIVETAIAETLVTLLDQIGFALNSEKSFFTGFIRESCGTDWLHGTPIRPVFLTKEPTNVSELFLDYNRLKRVLELRWLSQGENVLNGISTWIPDDFLGYQGPYSDEDFYSYMHSDQPHKGRYHNCMWNYRRLVFKPLPQRASAFFFRKLMATLRPNQSPTQKWEKRLDGGGCVFTVSRRNAMTVGTAYSGTDYWCRKYNDFYPASPKRLVR